MDNLTKTYIDNAFTEFRASIIRFVQSEVKAMLKDRVHLIIAENGRDTIEHLEHKLAIQLQYTEKKVLDFIANSYESIELQEKRIKQAHKASNELNQLFALIRKLAARIDRFHETKM